ncbi:MAG: glyoxalase/bleomycin resistance/dioxygenase family protein [Firmicutes bacterium]|nr:glyoxalase/bleomycin resistance/dioxygenase family protein [Bacillota bacterium]
MQIVSIELETHQLDRMRDFYSRTLAFPLSETGESVFSISAGATQVRFVAGKAKPCYHFAFDVREDRLSAGMKWLTARGVDLIAYEGDTLIDHADWNAHACYFRDPDGNIVEFIARHRLANARGSAAGSFDGADITCVSEVGWPVDDVFAQVDRLAADLGLEVWRSQRSDQFTPVGGEDGLLIVVPIGRPWFPTPDVAGVGSTRVTIRGGRGPAAALRTSEQPYEIICQSVD